MKYRCGIKPAGASFTCQMSNVAIRYAASNLDLQRQPAE
jgi:hypothetical protein